MANFEVYGKCEIKKNGVTVDMIAQLFKTSLAKYYNDGNITITPTGITVKGNLKSIWERAITKAEAKIKIEGNQLTYRVDGYSSLGGWPWVWFILGFFTGFFFIWFLWDLVEYIITRDRPKRYFEEAFKSVQFEIG
jgi:hypothetical protein